MSNARTRMHALALALLFCTGLGCKSNEPKEDPERKFVLYRETAVLHYADGDYDRAESQALKALEIHPDTEKLELMVAWCRAKRETRDSLLAAEQTFRRLAPTAGYEARLGLAASLERLGVLSQEAARDFASGKRSPSQAGVDPKQRAHELEEQARAQWRESAGLYAQLLNDKPADRSALNGMQRVQGLLGDYASVATYAARMLESLGEDRAFYQAQLLRNETSADDEARFRKALDDVRKLELETHLLCSDAFRRLGQREQARRELDQAQSLDPNRPETYGLRAKLLFEMGSFAAAISDIDQFLRLAPLPFEHPEIRGAYELRAKCEAALGSN